jgi:N-acyl-D-amino-acid deacylase
VFDILIKNGTIIDGTQASRYSADLGIQGDRIHQIGDLGSTEAKQTIDAAGKIVAPGFVDVHNHTDGWLLKVPNYKPKTTQGFTSEVIMADGISYAPVDERNWHEWIYFMRALNAIQFEEYTGWESIADYMELLDGSSAQNAITHIPYGNVRALACGFGRQPLDDFQMYEILDEIDKGMDAGAVGLSTGLDYPAHCYASTDELVEACRAMADQGGIYVSHVRYKKGLIPGIEEAVEIGKRAGVPVHISHMKATPPEDTDELLTYIDKVATQEVDFTFDVYPYLPGCTMLNYMLPYEAFDDGPLATLGKLGDPGLRAKFARSLESYPLENVHIAWLPGRENARYIGKLLSEYIETVGKPPAEALSDLLIEENMAVLLVFHHGNDDLIHPFLAHEKYMMGSDGIYFPNGAVHPRLYGSAARVLGPSVRDHHLFSLEDAVFKLSGFPAARFGLKERSVLKEGHFADVVVFDAETIVDKATYLEPHQFSVGVEHVLTNGVPVVADGEPIDDLPNPRPGRYLKFNA